MDDIKISADGMGLRSSEVRLAYPELLQRNPTEMNPKGKYQTAIVFGKELHDAIQTIINNRYTWAVQNKKEFTGIPVERVELPSVKPYGDSGELFVVRLSTDIKPKVIDQQLQPIQNADDPRVYGGVYARLNVVTYAWKFGNKVGISLGLGAYVQITREGERFGGGSGSLDDFAPVVQELDNMPQNAIQAPTNGQTLQWGQSYLQAPQAPQAPQQVPNKNLPF